MGQVEGESRTRSTVAHAPSMDVAAGRFDQNVGYVIQ
jgi:hypothetical protein